MIEYGAVGVAVCLGLSTMVFFLLWTWAKLDKAALQRDYNEREALWRAVYSRQPDDFGADVRLIGGMYQTRKVTKRMQELAGE